MNTFLSFHSLQLSISIEQLLLGLPPQRILLQQKIPNSIRSGIKLDLKTGLCRFLRTSTAECEVEPSAKTQVFDAPTLPRKKMTKFRKLTLLIAK